jgi:predicted enzyme related to lactoylglutathione lyase
LRPRVPRASIIELRTPKATEQNRDSSAGKGEILAHVVHFEISVPHPEQAVAFYSEVFGWSAQKLADPVQYWQLAPSVAPANAAIPGGIIQSKSGLSRVSVTIQVESLDETCARVTGMGGRIVTERRPVPGYGTHVLCQDPQGVFFALIEPFSKA